MQNVEVDYVVSIFNQLRRESLELLVMEETQAEHISISKISELVHNNGQLIAKSALILSNQKPAEETIYVNNDISDDMEMWQVNVEEDFEVHTRF